MISGIGLAMAKYQQDLANQKSFFDQLYGFPSDGLVGLARQKRQKPSPFDEDFCQMRKEFDEHLKDWDK